MKLKLALLFLLTISYAHSQSRSPAVEPVRGLSIDRGPAYQNKPGYQFKNGTPKTDTTNTSGSGVYAILFMVSLAAVPFILHMIVRGDVIVNKESNEVVDVTSDTNTEAVSLEKFRNKKSNEDVDIKKAS